MKPAFTALLLLVACKASSSDYQVQPGGGGSGHFGGSGQPDAAVTDGATVDATGRVGRVCLVSDPRLLAGCAGSGAGGIVVTLGSASATTADDGSFTIVPRDQSTMYVASGSGIATSARAASASLQIPAYATSLYDTMTTDTSTALLAAGQGAVIIRVRHAGTALAGATASSSDAVSDVYYDSSDPLTWSNDQAIGTNSFGAVWIPALQAGSATLTVQSVALDTSATPGVTVVEGAILFTDVDL